MLCIYLKFSFKSLLSLMSEKRLCVDLRYVEKEAAIHETICDKSKVIIIVNSVTDFIYNHEEI